MIKKYSLKLLQKAINTALLLDESMPSKIKLLHGKVLKITISPLGVYFFMYFSQGEMQLLDQYESTPNAIIESSPLGLIRLSVLPASKVRSLFNDHICISGDVALGQQVKKLFDDIDIDWEGHLARFTGDVIAYKLGSMVRHGLGFNRQVFCSIRDNVTEYLQEECRIFPPVEEADDFFKDVDELSLHVDRLEAKYNQYLMREGE